MARQPEKMSDGFMPSSPDKAEAAPVDDAWQLLLNRLSEGVLLVMEGRVVSFNPTFERMTGEPPDKLRGCEFADRIQPVIKPGQTAGRILCHQDHPESWDGGIITYTALLHCADSSHKMVEISTGPATRDGVAMDLVLIRDVSGQQKLREEVEKARQLESIAALSGGIAHDYNNLLAAILGNISLAMTSVPPTDDIFVLLKETQEATLLAKELTQKLITFSRGEKPVTETAAVAPVVKNAAEFSLSGSNIKPVFRFPQNLWPVNINQTQIGQAIYNLVINARDAMPDGGIIRIEARNVTVGEQSPPLTPGDYVMISIIDQGYGIADHHQGKIFDPYFTTKSKGVEKGTGLGLSICHSIIRKHGGDIAVESRVGAGTTMVVFLPASDQLIPKTAPAKAKRRASRTVLGRGRVLVMDDEKRIRLLAEKMLRYLGYEAAFAADGQQALEMYQEARACGKPFDVVVLDLTIRAGMGGKRTIEELLKIDPQVKAIVSSGYSDDPVMSDYRQYGFRGVVAKPYSLQDMSEQLNAVLCG